MHIRRKFGSLGAFGIAAALLVPLSTAGAVLATSGTASASGPEFYCTNQGGTVNFANAATTNQGPGGAATQATAGLSAKGQTSATNAYELVKITGATMSDCYNASSATGTNLGAASLGGGTLKISSRPCKDVPGTYTPTTTYCTSTEDGFLPAGDHNKYWFDSGYQYEKTGTSTLLTDLATIPVTVHGQSLVFHSEHTYNAVPYSTLAGFKITGYVTDAANSSYNYGSATGCSHTLNTTCLAELWSILGVTSGTALTGSPAYFLPNLNNISSYTSTHTTTLLTKSVLYLTTGHNVNSTITGSGAYGFAHL